MSTKPASSPRGVHPSRAGAVVAIATVLALGCAAPAAEEEAPESDESAATSVPAGTYPSWVEALKWFQYFRDNHAADYVASDRALSDARPWRSGYVPATDAVFAHNEIDIVGVTPDAVIAKLMAGHSDDYYVNSSAAVDCRTRKPITLVPGRDNKYCWTTFGTEQVEWVAEHVTGANEAVVAFEGGSAGVEFYHRFIARRTATGTHVVTEECERGKLANLSLYKKQMNPGLHASHELWLRGLKSVLEREARDANAR